MPKERWCAAQCIAYAIYITPVFFMWEKLIGTHYKPNWIRLPSRLPVGEHPHYLAADCTPVVEQCLQVLFLLKGLSEIAIMLGKFLRAKCVLLQHFLSGSLHCSSPFMVKRSCTHKSTH